MMKLKLDDAGHVVVQDGKPVYTNDDGSEVAFDAVGTSEAIKRLNYEAMDRRKSLTEAQEKLKAFDGMDAAAAKQALDNLSKIDQKKLIDAGEVDKVRGEINASWEGRFSEQQKLTEALQGQLNAELIGGNFARSKVIAEKLAIPSDMVQAAFGSAFKVEGGKLVAYNQAGAAIYSKANPGQHAGFDEALETLIDAYPNKDQIMKGNGSRGSGAFDSKSSHNGGGGNMGGTPAERRAALAAKYPELQ